MNNPYESNYDDYLEFHNKVIKDSKESRHFNEDVEKKFNTDEEVMDFYGAMTFDEYIKKLCQF